MATSSTIIPNPNEGVYKYTVVTSGRPTLDCVLHHNDLPAPAVDYLRKNGQADARVKRQMAKLSAGGGTPSPKGKDVKPVGFKKPSTQPLDPTEMSNYSPRTTTFVNGRPAPLASIKQQPLTPTALNLATPPSRASPESVRGGGSDNSLDDQEDAASVDSAPGLRQVHPRSKAPSSSLLAPAHASDRPPPPSRFPHDYPAATEENLDLYLEQFFPELQSLSDAELLRLMDPNPSVPALPARSSTLAILQEMLQTQGAYANTSSPSSLHPHSSPASNPPSSNWSIASDDHPHSASWSDTPSHNWRSPGSPAPGPSNWMSWQHAANPPSRSRKRQRSCSGSMDDLDWPTLTDQVPALSDDLPPSKRPFIHHIPQTKQEPDLGPHPHLFSELSTSASHNPLEPRPNPFASVSKLALMQPVQQQPQRYPQRGLDLQTYYSAQSVASQAPQHRLACGKQLGSSCESLASPSCLPPLEPASVLEQALRDLRAKPEALAA